MITIVTDPMRTLLISVILTTPLLCSAGIIASNDTAVPGDYTSYGYNSGENFYISFSVSQTYEGADFFVQFPNSGAAFQGTAYLTTTIGSGTQQSNEIAENTFTVPNTGTVNLVDVLNGQELLAGNTYYLTLGSSSGSGGSISATRTGEGVATLGSGVSNLTYGEAFGQNVAGYPPASAFSGLGCCSSGLVFSVQDSIAPEPSTFVLFAPALFLLPAVAWVRRTRQSRNY